MKTLISFLLVYGLTNAVYAQPVVGVSGGPLMDLYMESKDSLKAAQKEATKAAQATQNYYLDFDTGENHTKEYRATATALRSKKRTLALIQSKAINQRHKFGSNSPQYMQTQKEQEKAEAEYLLVQKSKDALVQKLSAQSELFKKGKNNPQFQQIRQDITNTNKRLEELNSAAYQAAVKHGLKSRQYKEMNVKYLKADAKLLNLHNQYDTLAANIMGPDWKKQKKAAQDKYAAAQKKMLDLVHKRNVYKTAHQCANMYLAGGHKQAKVLSILDDRPGHPKRSLQPRPWKPPMGWPGKLDGPLGFGFGQSLIQGFNPNSPPPRLPGEPGYHYLPGEPGYDDNEGSGSAQ